MVQPNEDNRGTANGKSQDSSGCPVQNIPSAFSASAPAASMAAISGNSEGSPPTSTTSSSSEGRGAWSSIAAWIPFRGGAKKACTNAGTGSGSNALSKASVSGGGDVSGCPVVKSSDDDRRTSRDGSTAELSGCPVQHDSSASNPTAEGAVGLAGLAGGGGDGGRASGSSNPAYNAANNEYVYGQDVFPGQEMPLSTARQRSSIPKADFNPSHQPKIVQTVVQAWSLLLFRQQQNGETLLAVDSKPTALSSSQEESSAWVYPSEQQYYNAIKRKGYNTSAKDMPSTLAIHNAVNEKGWEMVRDWERVHAAADASSAVAASTTAVASGDRERGRKGDVPAPKLLRFTGRPKDVSPKAWLKTNLLGYHPPFDRHDWVVKRADGSEARYVIDFYAGKIPPGSNIPVGMHLDVRPALDSFDAVVDRTRMFYGREVRPYLAGVLDAFKSDPGSPEDASKGDAPPPSATR